MDKQEHHNCCYCLLDLNYSSNLLSTKIADIPHKLKYETILAPIFEYCFGTSDQNIVWEEFTEEEKESFKDDHANNKSDYTSTIKIDWIRDETFLYNQIFNLADGKVNILARKLGLLNNRKFILNSRYGIYDFYLNEEFRNDKELMMEIVKEKGLTLKYASDKLRNDKDIVKEAVTRDGMAIQFASEELKDDKEIVMIALESGEEAYNYASERLKNDNDIVMKTLLHTLKYPKRSQQSRVSEDKLREIFNNDRELLLNISKVNESSTLQYASYELRNDKEFVLKVIQQEDGFYYASDELKNDREFVKECVKVNGKCLYYAAIEFRDDREIVELALKSYPSAISFISDRFRNDIEFISNSIGKGGFLELPDEFSNDREIVLESTKLYFPNFKKASDELKNDREFILQLVKHSPMHLLHCREFVQDREIAMAAVSQDSQMLFALLALFFDDEEIIIKASQTSFKSQTTYRIGQTYFIDTLSDRLKNDREFYKKCGGFFDSFPRKYQLDREIVMECLKTHPDSVLRNVYPLIATDRLLAIRIVKRDGLLLGEMPCKYRNDRELVSCAIQQNKEAFKFVSDELSNDLQILKLYQLTAHAKTSY